MVAGVDLEFVILSNSLNMENRFKEGEVVEERIRPGQKLVVSHFSKHVYYCKVQENQNRKELVYFESDLISRPSLRAL